MVPGLFIIHDSPNQADDVIIYCIILSRGMIVTSVESAKYGNLIFMGLYTPSCSNRVRTIDVKRTGSAKC